MIVIVFQSLRRFSVGSSGRHETVRKAREMVSIAKAILGGFKLMHGRPGTEL